VEGHDESIVVDDERKSQAGLETRRRRGRLPHSASSNCILDACVDCILDAYLEGES
jgi:hypothetical protein